MKKSLLLLIILILLGCIQDVAKSPEELRAEAELFKKDANAQVAEAFAYTKSNDFRKATELFEKAGDNYKKAAFLFDQASILFEQENRRCLQQGGGIGGCKK